MSIDRLNLLPQKSISDIKYWMPEIIFSAAVLGFAFVVFSSIFLQLTNTYLSNSLNEMKSENTNVAAQLKSLDEQSAASKAKRDKLGILQGLKGGSYAWSKILKELSLTVPNGVWLTEFHTVKDQEDKSSKVVLIKGEGKSQKDVMKFFKSLKKSKYFKGAEFQSSERLPSSEPVVYSFFIEIWMGG